MLISQTFTLTVGNRNDAPTGSIPRQAAFEDQPFTLDLSLFLTDQDEGDTLTFDAQNLPESLALDADTGLITGTPDTEDDFSLIL